MGNSTTHCNTSDYANTLKYHVNAIHSGIINSKSHTFTHHMCDDKSLMKSLEPELRGLRCAGIISDYHLNHLTGVVKVYRKRRKHFPVTKCLTGGIILCTTVMQTNKIIKNSRK